MTHAGTQIDPLKFADQLRNGKVAQKNRNYTLVSFTGLLNFALNPIGFCGIAAPKDDYDLRAFQSSGNGFGPSLARIDFVCLEPARQRAWTFRIGLSLTIGSFLNCNKYPPSLDFLLMTLGPALMLLLWFGAYRFSPKNPLIVFGLTPLFFFVVHFLLAHLLAIPIALVRYGRADFLCLPMPSMGGSTETYPPGYGLGLGATYVVWAVVLVLMYPLCLWFKGMKERRPVSWLAYC